MTRSTLRNLVRTTAIAAFLPALALALPAAAEDAAPKLVRITVQNLTTGQGFSPSFFASHSADAAPLFKLGEAATMPLWSVAEEGNIGGFSGQAAGALGTTFGDAALAIHTPPGGTRVSYVAVDAAHPLISGVFMLGMTNDGFSGISGYDAYDLTAPVSIDLMAYDAGSEVNSERKGYLGALGGGNMRDPENGVVSAHSGIRGDADAPAEWKFDPAKPVARLTLTPVEERDAFGAMSHDSMGGAMNSRM